MTQARLRIVGKKLPERSFVEKVRLYYFPLDHVAYNLEVTEEWVIQQIPYLTDNVKMDGMWYFSPDDYHKLRELRDKT